MKPEQNYDHHLGGYRADEARINARADTWKSVALAVLIIAFAVFLLV